MSPCSSTSRLKCPMDNIFVMLCSALLMYRELGCESKSKLIAQTFFLRFNILTIMQGYGY